MPISPQEAEQISSELNQTVTTLRDNGLLVPYIFGNNLLICLVMFVPVIGPLLGLFIMFNTGTVVGVNANIFGPGFQRNFIPSFTWGGTAGHTNYDLKKAIEVAESVCKRRNVHLDEVEKDLLTSVYNLTLRNKRL